MTVISLPLRSVISIQRSTSSSRRMSTGSVAIKPPVREASGCQAGAAPLFQASTTATSARRARSFSPGWSKVTCSSVRAFRSRGKWPAISFTDVADQCGMHVRPVPLQEGIHPREWIVPRHGMESTWSRLLCKGAVRWPRRTEHDGPSEKIILLNS